MVEALQVLLFPAFSVFVTELWVHHYWAGLLMLILPLLMLRDGMQDYQEIEDYLFAVVETLLSALDLRDAYTAKHCQKVSEYACIIAKHLGYNEIQLDALRKKTMLHDIGKLVIKDEVLLKPGKLTNEEFAHMKEHTMLKEILVDRLPQEFEITRWIDVALHHHERYDGSGYPDGLKRNQIPLDARIMTVADVWDGVTSGRVYRTKGFTHEEALKILGAQGLADPEVLVAFMKAYQAGEIQAVLTEDPEHRHYTDEQYPKASEFLAIEEDFGDILAMPEETTQTPLVKIGSDTYKKPLFSSKKILWQGFSTLIFLAIATIYYYTSSAPFAHKLPFFYAGLFATLEMWQFREPFNFPVCFGDAAFLASLFLFPLKSVLALVCIVSVIRMAFLYFTERASIPQMSKRWGVFILSALFFNTLGLRGNHQVFLWSHDSKPFFMFASWVIVHATLTFLALNLNPLLHRGFSQVSFYPSQLLRFSFFSILAFPLIGYALSLYASPRWFNYAFIFLAFVYVRFILYKLRGETEYSARYAVEVLATITDRKLGYTKYHATNVSSIVKLICQKMGLSSNETEWVKSVARIHDIGSIGVPDRIFNMDGDLSPKETETVKKHCFLGAEIVSKLPLYNRDVQKALQSHHERYDGSGYPRRLKGRKIPLAARIVAVADSFDAMISPRPDRAPFTIAQAVEEIAANRGKQFDPAVVRAFIDLYHRGKIEVVEVDLVADTQETLASAVPVFSN